MVTTTLGPPITNRAWPPASPTMTQQVGITMGRPIMSAVATGAGTWAVLGDLKVAIAVNAAIVLLGTLTSALFLRGARPSAR